MAKVGRPPKVKEQDMPELVRRFEDYIKSTEVPIIAEFAYQNGFGKQYFHEREEFSNLIKMATAKKEATLEKKTLTGEYNPAMAIFSLKQLGWKDKQEIEHSGTLDVDIERMSDNEILAGIETAIQAINNLKK